MIVRVAKRRRCGIASRKVRKIRKHGQQFAVQKAQRVAVEHKIGVIRNIAARRTQMKNPRSGGRSLAIGIDMRHDIVTYLALTLRSKVKIDVGNVRLQLVHLLCANRQPQLVLRTRKLRPEPAPDLNARPLRKEREHIIRGIARGQRRFITFRAHKFSFFSGKSGSHVPRRRRHTQCGSRLPAQHIRHNGVRPQAARPMFSRRKCRISSRPYTQ